jgi:hypothetical protein
LKIDRELITVDGLAVVIMALGIISLGLLTPFNILPSWAVGVAGGLFLLIGRAWVQYIRQLPAGNAEADLGPLKFVLDDIKIGVDMLGANHADTVAKLDPILDASQKILANLPVVDATQPVVEPGPTTVVPLVDSPVLQPVNLTSTATG